MNNNQFYKMPADLLQFECVQKILANKGGTSLFGLTILMWMAIQASREKRMSSRMIKNSFAGISSIGQRKSVLESGFFDYDPETDTYGIQLMSPRACAQPGAQPTAQPGAQPTAQPGAQPRRHALVPFHDNLEIELEIEGEGDTRETTTTPGIRNEELEMRNDPAEVIAEVKGMDPHKGELWIGVLLYCPDQELRRTMLEHWEQTMGYIEQHLKSSGRIDEVKDTKSLFVILQELVQPKSPIFGGLKLFLMQDAKSDTEKAFDQWLSGLNNICQMQQPLTYTQLQELGKAGYSAAQIRQTAERLNNYPNTPYKYVSAYQTIKEWLQNPRK